MEDKGQSGNPCDLRTFPPKFLHQSRASF